MNFHNGKNMHTASLEGALEHANITPTESIQNVIQQVVLIETIQEHDEIVYGTGLLITENGYVATVNHNIVDPEHYHYLAQALKKGTVPKETLVTDPATGKKTFKYRIRTQDGNIHPLTPWMSTHSPHHDAALLKAAIRGEQQVIPYNVLERTLTTGAPLEYVGLTPTGLIRCDGTVKESSISYMSERLGSIQDSLKMNLPAKPGWSGGVLMLNGALVGLLSEGGYSFANTPDAYVTKVDKLQKLIQEHLTA